MILSKYLNPPYRTPITKSTPIRPSSRSPPNNAAIMPDSVTPALHASASASYVSPSKRKRCSSDVDLNGASAPAMPSARLNPLEEDILPQGAESPRSKVAERLRGLELSCSAPVSLEHGSHASEESDGERKKVRRIKSPNISSKRGHANINDDNTTTTTTNTTPTSSPEPASPSLHLTQLFSSTTNQAPSSSAKSSHSRPKRRLSSPPPPVNPAMIFPNDEIKNHDGNDDDDDKNNNHIIRLATPPLMAILGGSSSPRNAASASADPTSAATVAALTWQPAEITGHRIDTGNPDDDGEGINGLGFQPTAAIAYVRSQRRKQQVSEWKAREAREARQRRFERRKGSSGGGGTHGRPARDSATLGPAKARVVRFAGVS